MGMVQVQGRTEPKRKEGQVGELHGLRKWTRMHLVWGPLWYFSGQTAELLLLGGAEDLYGWLVLLGLRSAPSVAEGALSHLSVLGQRDRDEIIARTCRWTGSWRWAGACAQVLAGPI